MAKLYKLTDQNNETYNHTKWGPSVTHETNGEGEMCGPGWLHAYTSPELAVLLNQIHADFSNPHLWESEGIIQKNDHGLKVGTTRLTTIREIPLPQITTQQRAFFALLCGLQVYKDPSFSQLAKDYISGVNRSYAAANAANAARAAENAARAASRINLQKLVEQALSMS